MRGIHLTLLLGPTAPVPAPPPCLEALEKVEVKHSDQERSGFQLTFHVGRGGPLDMLDFPLLRLPLLKPHNRVVLTLLFNATPRVLMDGIITEQQLVPGNAPGTGTLAVRGQDVSIAMDRVEKSAPHPAQDETVIATKLIASYAQYGLVPKVVPPPTVDPPNPTDRVPTQQNTDLKYLQAIAARHGYVFYVTPGPAPLMNTAYWGPPVRVGLPQKALTANMGAETNVSQISFQYNARAGTTVEGKVQDRSTNSTMPVRTFASLRPPLAAMPDWMANAANLRVRQFRESGLTGTQALARAQGTMDAATDQVVTATGEIDSVRYGQVLQARGLVGVRGCGFANDGFYYVKNVTHVIRRGEYKQQFTLTRDGSGSLSPVVPV